MNTLDRLTLLANAHREGLEAEWNRQMQAAEHRERREAVEAAQAFIDFYFPATLSHVIGRDTWTGYPALREGYAEAEPTAVAPIEPGLWLHFEHIGPNVSRLTLHGPCPCGAHSANQISDDYGLAETLDDRTTGCHNCR